MYNKYRTQFAVIHNLEKEISIPKPIIAQLKNKLRYEMAQEETRRFQNGHCVKDFGDGSAIVLLPIIGTHIDTPLDEAIRIFEDNYEMRCANSPYDCTGQMFTVWYKLVKRQEMWYAYHYIGCDC